MSKKTRKKSPTKSRQTSAVKPRAAKAARGGPKTTVKKSAAKLPKTAPRKPTKSAAGPAPKALTSKPAKPNKTAPPKESHKPASKPLKSNLSASETAIPGALLAEGGKAPTFRLPRDGGETVALSDFAGKKLVVFFYPRADTPGCTREAIDFTRLKEEFAGQGTALLGVSADTVKAQESFRDKHQLAIPLISDEKHEMLEAYGAWGEKSMYGRSFMGIIRTTVLIDANGRIVRIWRNVRVDGHAEEVLAATRTS
jgi:peroxiredoxin Q/BCP